jgi:hypothetical protein
MTVLSCGDWDPSGLHMREVDLPARLKRYGRRITLTRVALTADDVSPAFPDSRRRTRRRTRGITGLSNAMARPVGSWMPSIPSACGSA